MKEKLKVGDRVRMVGYSVEASLIDGLRGEITSIEESTSSCEVRSAGHRTYLVTLSQCKRLKPRKPPREFWIAFHRGGAIYGIFNTLEGAQKVQNITAVVKEVIHVKEVRNKK